MRRILILGLLACVEAQNAAGSAYVSLNHVDACTCKIPNPATGVADVVLPYGSGPSCRGMTKIGGENMTQVYGATGCPAFDCTCPPRYFRYVCGAGRFNPPLDSAPQNVTGCQGETGVTCFFCMRCENLEAELARQILPVATPQVRAGVIQALQAPASSRSATNPLAQGLTAAQAAGFAGTAQGLGIIAQQAAATAATMAAGLARLPTCTAPVAPACVGPACGKKMCGIVAGEYPTAQELPSKELPTFLVSAKWMAPKGSHTDELLEQCQKDCTCHCPDGRKTAELPASPCTCPDGYMYWSVPPNTEPGAKQCGDPPFHCSVCVKPGLSTAGIIVVVLLFTMMFAGIYYCYVNKKCCFGGKKDGIDMEGEFKGADTSPTIQGTENSEAETGGGA